MNIRKFLKDQYQFIIGFIIFIGIVLGDVEFYKAVIVLLEFIVILEIVKMIGDFLEKNKLSLRFILDVFIVFLTRDILILVTKPHMDKQKIVFLILVIFVFFIFRYLSVKYSPTLFKKNNHRK